VANPTMKIGEIIDLLLANTGQNMTEDIMYQWFEELYRMVRETKWSWNWLWEGRVTFEPSTTSDAVLWSGVEGNNYITLDGGGSVLALALNVWTWKKTGRVFYWDERLYRVVNGGAHNNNRLYIDKPLHNVITSQKLKFCRQNHAFRTSSIKTVEVDFLKKVSTLNDDFIRDFLVTRTWTEEGAPITWKVDDNFYLPRPVSAPLVGSTVGATFVAGTYYYFWAYVDQESGLISQPGPVLEYTATLNQQPVVSYGSTNLGEHTYGLRLFRSSVNPKRVRVPMYAVNGPSSDARAGVVGMDSERDYMWQTGTAGDKHPTDAANTVTDTLSDTALLKKEKYYDGPWTTIDMVPCPDDVYSFDVYRLNNWGFRPSGSDYIDLGRNNQVLELLRMGIHQFTELQNRDATSFRNGVVQFRQQLAYLLREDRTAASEDPGVDRHRDYRSIKNISEYDPTKYWHWTS